jgi:hypothetical protein
MHDKRKRLLRELGAVVFFVALHQESTIRAAPEIDPSSS